MKFKPKGWSNFKKCLKDFNNNFDNLYLTDVFQKLIEKSFTLKHQNIMVNGGSR